jgi:hypothetical protein
MILLIFIQVRDSDIFPVDKVAVKFHKLRERLFQLSTIQRIGIVHLTGQSETSGRSL